MKQYLNVAVAVSLALGAAGCGSDNDTAAASVDGIVLHINSINDSDIRLPGQVTKDENIGQGTSTSWNAFIDRATERCATTPRRLAVTQVTVSLDLDGSKVRSFEEVVSGEAVVFFASTRGSDEDATKVDVARQAYLSGSGPVSMDIMATPQELTKIHERLLGGDFHVGFRAATALDEKDDFSMDVLVELAAAAHCD